MEKKLLLLISSSDGHQPGARQSNALLHARQDELPPKQASLLKVNEPSVNFYPGRVRDVPQLLDAPVMVPQHQSPIVTRFISVLWEKYI